MKILIGLLRFVRILLVLDERLVIFLMDLIMVLGVNCVLIEVKVVMVVKVKVVKCILVVEDSEIGVLK